MKKLKTLFILASWITTSCAFINPLEDAGEYTESRIETGEISKIQVDGIFNVTLIPDDESYFIFKGGENILDEFEYTTDNETLQINHKYSNWFHNLDIPEIEIHTTSLKEIRLQRSCNLHSKKTITGNHLSIFITEEADVVTMNLQIQYAELKFDSRGSSSGKHILSGNCENASYTLNSSNNLHAENLKSENITISHNGLGNAYVSVEKKLSVTFFSSGNIYYKGNPKIEVRRVKINNQKPTGKVIPG